MTRSDSGSTTNTIQLLPPPEELFWDWIILFEASKTFCNTCCWTISRSDWVFVGVAKELDTDADLDDLRRDEEGMIEC